MMNKADLANYEGCVSDIQQLQRKLSDEINNIETHVDEMNDEFDSVCRELSEAEDDNKELERELEKEQEKTERLEAQVKELTAQVEHLASGKLATSLRRMAKVMEVLAQECELQVEKDGGAENES